MWQKIFQTSYVSNMLLLKTLSNLYLLFKKIFLPKGNISSTGQRLVSHSHPYPHHLVQYMTPACVRAQLLQSCPSFCGLMDGSPPRSSVHGILQAGILEWIAMPSSKESSQLQDQTLSLSSPALVGRQVLYH